MDEPRYEKWKNEFVENPKHHPDLNIGKLPEKREVTKFFIELNGVYKTDFPEKEILTRALKGLRVLASFRSSGVTVYDSHSGKRLDKTGLDLTCHVKTSEIINAIKSRIDLTEQEKSAAIDVVKKCITIR